MSGRVIEDSAAHFAASPGAPPAAVPERARDAARREGAYDVVVIGAGHAGCEAAFAAAKLACPAPITMTSK